MAAPINGTADQLIELVSQYAAPALFGSDAASVKIEESAGPTGGFSGEMKRFTLTSDGQTRSVVMKHFPERRHAGSKALGLAREGMFYNWAKEAPERVSGTLASFLPRVYYSKGDMATGEKVILMEDLTVASVSASSLYGHASPVNWGKNERVDADIVKAYEQAGLPASTDPVAQQKAIERLCSLEIARTMAHYHALYWREPGQAAAADTSDLPDAWFSGSWFKNARTTEPAGDCVVGKQAWQGSLAYTIGEWRKFEQNVLPTGKINLDPRLAALIERAITDTTWENYVEDMRNRSWSLVHGDCHPGNMIWREGKIVLVDWEAFGFGNGPAEVAQFLISHATPETRRSYEKEVLDTYFDIILKEAPNGADPVARRAAFEDEYKCCGLGRWLWMLGVCSTACTVEMNQYFMNQMVAFCEDHGLFEERANLPIMIRP
jgi:hypothetical protein